MVGDGPRPRGNLKRRARLAKRVKRRVFMRVETSAVIAWKGPRLLASGFFLFAETLRAWVGQLKDGPVSLVGVLISWGGRGRPISRPRPAMSGLATGRRRSRRRSGRSP
jgi:hypothetical protein